MRLSPNNRTGEWDSVFTGYSRDGFHWYRPIDDSGRHRVFLPQDTTEVELGLYKIVASKTWLLVLNLLKNLVESG
jgi:hypothetical protein